LGNSRKALPLGARPIEAKAKLANRLAQSTAIVAGMVICEIWFRRIHHLSVEDNNKEMGQKFLGATMLVEAAPASSPECNAVRSSLAMATAHKVLCVGEQGERDVSKEGFTGFLKPALFKGVCIARPKERLNSARLSQLCHSKPSTSGNLLSSIENRKLCKQLI
jgi:hypothetical protein